MNQLEQDIINIIAEEGKVERGDITKDSSLYDLGIDSLTSLEVLIVLETKYDIRISETRLKNVNSVGEIIRAVVDEVQKKHGRSERKHT